MVLSSMLIYIYHMCTQATLPLGDRRRPSNRAMAALQRAQHDKVRAVREAARGALAVFKDLQVPTGPCVSWRALPAKGDSLLARACRMRRVRLHCVPPTEGQTI